MDREQILARMHEISEEITALASHTTATRAQDRRFSMLEEEAEQLSRSCGSWTVTRPGRG
jgi:hypothetical protein